MESSPAYDERTKPEPIGIGLTIGGAIGLIVGGVAAGALGASVGGVLGAMFGHFVEHHEMRLKELQEGL